MLEKRRFVRRDDIRILWRCAADDGATASKPVSLPTVRYVNDDYKQRRCS